MFVAYLLTRNIRYEEDLVDQLFNSSEKRLARILLLLAHFGKEGVPETVIPKISQEMLAEMIGTTRSRVSFFMNRFRKLGFIDYDGWEWVSSSQFTSQHRSPRLVSAPKSEAPRFRLLSITSAKLVIRTEQFGSASRPFRTMLCLTRS